jgi:hypothetical protein
MDVVSLESWPKQKKTLAIRLIVEI